MKHLEERNKILEASGIKNNDFDGVAIVRDSYMESLGFEGGGNAAGGSRAAMIYEENVAVFDAKYIIVVADWMINLPKEEIAAVLYHELGHIKYHADAQIDEGLEKEMQADQYAADHGYSEALISYMKKFLKAFNPIYFAPELYEIVTAYATMIKARIDNLTVIDKVA